MLEEKIHVLIVDDDEDDFILIRSCFDQIQRVRFCVEWVATYNNALLSIKNNKYDVCFFDYRLDGRTGIDLLQEVVGQDPYLPVIILTGLDDYDIDMKAMKLGATDYLIKGEINEYTLERSIRYSMERMRSHRELKRIKDVALHQSERKYACLFQQSPDAIILMNENGCILNLNPAAERLIESTLPEVQNQSLFQLAVWRQESVKLLKEHVLNKGVDPRLPFELEARRRDQSNLSLEALLNQVQRSDKELWLQLILRNITERKRAEKAIHLLNEELELRVQQRTVELKKAQKQLLMQERMAALGQLIATVAHEIRNPLSTVRSSIFSIEDAQKKQDHERFERALVLAERNVLRCDGIITELLDFSRKKAPQLSPVRVDEWLALILKEIQLPEEIQFSTSLSADLLATIDPWSLKNAIVNIVDNAIQAFEGHDLSQKPVITLSSTCRKGRIEIMIQDNASGMEAETLERALEPLYSTKAFGIGLGLPIAQKIIQEHDGGIEIISEHKKGTTVLLWLPVCQTDKPTYL